ncbi:hypothetical protein Barb6_02236 [Bacteroidales bacterium Barb6]|nr:hypothetical protein Barb6_02236 [Bacteroidales bacterium Barb6]
MKSFHAKGKRITLFEVAAINELEPVRFPDEEAEAELDTERPTESLFETPAETPAAGKQAAREEDEADLIDKITGQMKLFDD